MRKTAYRLSHWFKIIMAASLTVPFPVIEAIAADYRNAIDQAFALEDQGQLREASAILVASPARIQSSTDPIALAVVKTARKPGIDAMLAGKSQKAEACFRQASMAVEADHGTDHYMVVEQRQDFATLFEDMGRTEEAAEFCRRPVTNSRNRFRFHSWTFTGR